MSIICFASLKGGVGKTSLSINVAHAFARRGCRTLLLDFDPAAHASRWFKRDLLRKVETEPSPLVQVILSDTAESALSKNPDEAIDIGALIEQLTIQRDARNLLDVISGGMDLRHFLWGKGARLFRHILPKMLAAFEDEYDYVIIDTPPDSNVLTRTAIAHADIASVPLDSSEMSIHCLEELLISLAHIRGPSWALIRSMVTRSASRIQNLANTNIQRLLEEHGRGTFEDTSPIYLLRAMSYRTEQQNRLSFLGKTAFDQRETADLAEQYINISRELDAILSLRGSPNDDFENSAEEDEVSEEDFSHDSFEIKRTEFNFSGDRAF